MASSLLHCSDKLPFMDVETILHMKEGLGETSYAQNSSLQKRGMDTLKSLITNSATDVYMSQMPERFTVADLGCSSGPNALCLVEDIVGSIGRVCGGARRSSQPPPEFSVLLNDLPTNDFNTIFFSLPEFTDRLKAAAQTHEWGRPMVFLSGVPGSFYGRLFPRNSVHFICSCSSLHWLSQVPPGLFDGDGDGDTASPINKGKMYISSTSPPAVPAAYLRQFQRDFGLFLRSRAAEVVPGGRMVLAMLGRQTAAGDIEDRRTTFLWELLSESFAALVARGLVEQEKVDAYNVPFYAPSVREVEEEVRREGSFRLDHVQTYEINLSSSGDAKEDGRTVSMAIRAIQESMLSHHFGPDIVDALFHKYTELVTESMEREEVKSIQIGVVLTR
ncbi:hypothetical protein U9M48_017984, partial [Paspalum notatum var. saurae]